MDFLQPTSCAELEGGAGMRLEVTVNGEPHVIEGTAAGESLLTLAARSNGEVPGRQ